VISEFGDSIGQKWLDNKYIAAGIAVVSAYLMAFRGSANVIWPLFGATNQLIAGLALLTVTVYLAENNKPTVYTMIPMIFMVFMTTWGMVGNFRNYLAAGNTLLAVIDGIIIVLEVWMIVEAVNVLGRVRQGQLGQPNVRA
jgi:carbon starvation protein